MTKRISLLLMSLHAFLLTGCMNIEPALSGKAYDDYMRSIKPYIEYWKNPGVTTETRSLDAIDCGGSSRGTDFSNAQLSIAKQAGENDREVRARLTQGWQRCMIAKGYRFTGGCYDNEVGRSSPACIGRTLESLK